MPQSEEGHVLLRDEFRGLHAGPIREAMDGPYREMHAQPALPGDNLDGWQCKTGHWSVRNPWSCVETPAGKRIRANIDATVYDNVILYKGEPDWRDLEFTCEVTLLERSADKGWSGPAGLIFRVQDSQRYLAALIDRDGMAKLARRTLGHWDVLAATQFDLAAGTGIRMVVRAYGAEVEAQIGAAVLRARDPEQRAGYIGLIGARPAEFGPILVRCAAEEASRLRQVRVQNAAQLIAKRQRAAQPELWKALDTPGFGAGRRIRIGDLDGDGRPEFIFPRARDDQPGQLVDVSGITAMNLEGKVLWQVGEIPPVPEIERSADTPIQVHDIDGDGKAEVVAVMGRRVVVLDGATGRERFALDVPSVAKLPDCYKENMLHWGGGFGDETEQWPVAALAFADLRGRGSRRDLLLLDHYHHTIAIDLEHRCELWRVVNPHGHFPCPVDFDGNGREDVLLGYRRVSPEGKLKARICMQDHQDAIFCGPLDDEGAGPRQILMAAGEDGLLRLTPDYNVAQRVMGHVQRLAVGKFRGDRRGLCVATVLFHGNRGIVSLFDANLMRIWTRDFPVIGATLQPVLFDDSGVEYMFLSAIRPAQGYPGGLLDGDGELVVPLPDDGGPGLCAFACDLDGDGLDELLAWDHERLWIYHSTFTGDRRGLLRRVRPPLHNFSNFVAYASIPAR